MEYFLIEMEYYISDISGTFHLLQLVKASNKDNAREAIKISANKEHILDEHIIQIKIFDTIFGD